MNNDSDAEKAGNYRVAIKRFATGYNKGVVLSSITHHSLDILNGSMTKIEGGLSSVVTAFEEIRATSGSTAGNGRRINGMMAEIQGNNEAINNGIAARMQDVEKGVAVARELEGMFLGLQEKTRMVASMTSSIQDVSDRTNILAINASIEAARAGAVGKGFRIIANEVRTLAAQTGDFAKQIDGQLSEFSSSVSSISGRMKEFVAMFTRFRESFAEVSASSGENTANINQATQLLAQIASAIEEETLALSEGLHSLEAISLNSRDTRAVFGAIMDSHQFLDKLLDRED